MAKSFKLTPPPMRDPNSIPPLRHPHTWYVVAVNHICEEKKGGVEENKIYLIRPIFNKNVHFYPEINNKV
jgi:hypothetical protein